MRDTYKKFRKILFSGLSKAKNWLPGDIWIILLTTTVTFGLLVSFVPLKPHVDNNFFFSSDDPQFHNENLISRLFPRTDSQLIISASGDIFSQNYFNRVQQLSETLLLLDAVTGVKSVSHGPTNTDAALESPLWRRLLIAEDWQSTNIIVLLDETASEEVVPKIEDAINIFAARDFELKISGLPYIVELIRRNLLRDLRVFSLIAFILFSGVVYLVFRRWSILWGTALACLNACVFTLLISTLLGAKIGILTANLATIVFVLTLSHIIFLTFNWKKVFSRNDLPADPTDKAIRITFPASFWSMTTTALGFWSLTSVPAKPLRELGISGVIGTLCAIAAAYLIYPRLLRLSDPSPGVTQDPPATTEPLYRRLKAKATILRAGTFFLCLLCVPGLFRLNTDPSLISYFDSESEIAEGLRYIDRNGGSSPMVVVLRTTSGETLNNGKTYQQLWDLQEALERHPAVGTILSLPVLMAEGKRNPLAFFLSWEWLLNILEKPQHGEVAKNFVTEDRKYGLFLLRMKEANRQTSRLEIVDDIKDIVKKHDFYPELTGGVFVLQGHLSRLVASSLLFGLSKLIFLFIVVGFIVSRLWKVTAAMIASITLIPVLILGMIGWFRIPLDIISAPAANVAIALGIDFMIHMTTAFRRYRKENGDKDIWEQVRQDLWKPILTSTLIVGAGFGIFAFSTFPPTQRFGGAIIFGTLAASLIALFIFPYLADLRWSEVQSEVKEVSLKLRKGMSSFFKS